MIDRKKIIKYTLMGCIGLFTLLASSNVGRASAITDSGNGIINSEAGSDIISTPEPSIDESWNSVCFAEQSIVRAIGTECTLTLINVVNDPSTYIQSWSSSNPSIATVDETGKVVAVGEGQAVISTTIQANGLAYMYSCQITVTNPILVQGTYLVTANNKLELKIAGTISECSSVVINDTSIATVDSVSPVIIKGKKEGKVVVTVEVDGRILTCTVQVTNPKINKSLELLVKGKKSQLKVTGHSKLTDVKYSSGNKKIATVSSKGLIKAKNLGSTYIYITVDHATYKCSVSVGTTKTIGVLKRARAALGTPYSQAKRMRKGYYDCSSFVWRCYKPYKIYFGNTKNAPTAAGQAYYLVRKKKVIAYKAVSESKLKPGDVLYISSKKNKRYKNITHTAMYIGNGKIIHSSTGGVAYTSYSRYKSTIVVIARPTK